MIELVEPGDLFEWWCVPPRGMLLERCDSQEIFHSIVDGFIMVRVGVNLLISIDHEFITWLSSGNLYSIDVNDMYGSYPNLTGSVSVFPKRV